MFNHHPVLFLLGLALRGGRLVIGEEPVEGIVRARDARILLLARDASDNTFRRCRHFAEVGQCLWITVPFTKDELGFAVGRSSVAIMAVTDVGLAHAIVQKLALEDPKRYAEAAARLELKARRAAERRAEQKAHERNVRTGKYHGKQNPPPPPEPAAPPARRPDAPGKGPGGPAHHGKPAPHGGFHHGPAGADGPHKGPKSRPSKENRPKPKAASNRFAHSRPVKKGKGSFRTREG